MMAIEILELKKQQTNKQTKQKLDEDSADVSGVMDKAILKYAS